MKTSGREIGVRQIFELEDFEPSAALDRMKDMDAKRKK